MNAERLFALYDRVADAPNGVARLRRVRAGLWPYAASWSSRIRQMNRRRNC